MRMLSAVVMGIGLALASTGRAEKLDVGSPAPTFTLKTQDGKDWSLADRKGKGWTVVFFYPKAGSPGCITQVCAYNDRTQSIRAKNAVIIGISADDQADQKKFHDEHKLAFDLLSDADGKVIDAYGTKMALVSKSSRQTFIVDPQLVIRAIDSNVEPAFDADIVAHELDELQNPPKPGSEEDPD